MLMAQRLNKPKEEQLAIIAMIAVNGPLYTYVDIPLKTHDCR